MSLPISRGEPFPLATFLDVIERGVVASLFGLFVFRQISAFVVDRNPVYLTIVVSESLVVLFILIRRAAKTVSLRPSDWLLAFGATAGPLCVAPGGAEPLLPNITCGLIIIAGVLLQIYAKLTLRRSFGIIAANRGVTTAGPYRLVRHPMYVAYMISWAGFFLASPTLWNAAIYGFAFICQIARLMAEERLLNEDAAYRSFAAVVPYRLLPGVF
jgi:protein-S-isoprenylcysteine O-methyltransferase Ste14